MTAISLEMARPKALALLDGTALGIALLSFSSVLPSFAPFACIAAVSLLAAWRLNRRTLAFRCAIFIFAVSFGCAWGAWHGQSIWRAQLPLGMEGERLELRGWVGGLPEIRMDQRGRLTRFVLIIDASTPQTSLRRARLSWFEAPQLHGGDYLQVDVRLRRARGWANPGGFDYQLWLIRRDIDATGYVLNTTPSVRPAPDARWQAVLTRWRASFCHALSERLSAEASKPLIMALACGDRSALGDDKRELLRATGTSHLLAISGLHIGLAWLWGYLLAIVLARPILLLSARCPAHLYGVGGGLCCALIYSGLAGFSLPTQRALVMLSAFSFAQLMRRRLSAGVALRAALCICLLLDPLAARSLDFWLSFVAVVVLIYGLAGLGRGGFRSLLRAQLAVSIGLLAPLLLYTAQLPWIGLVANLVAVPLLSFALVPLTLAGGVVLPFTAFSEQLLAAAQYAAVLLLDVLEAVVAFAPAKPLWTPSGQGLLVAVCVALGAACLLLPRAFPGRWVGTLFFLPLFVPQTFRDAPLLELTVLDVGQGLAIVVKTADGVLVYDAGDRFSSRFDAGRAVVTPFLRHSGVRDLDILLISHSDRDHVGGARSVLDAYPARRILAADDLPDLGRNFVSCEKGLSWRSGAARFRILSPGAKQLKASSNNRSCVLLIDVGKTRFLLPGDIERSVEHYLLGSAAEWAPVDVLVAPHHGSKTSSTHRFLRAARPRYAVFSTGYGNRFAHPHPSVAARYRRLDVTAFDTAQDGALSFVVDGRGELRPPRAFRRLARRYWWRWP